MDDGFPILSSLNLLYLSVSNPLRGKDYETNDWITDDDGDGVGVYEWVWWERG